MLERVLVATDGSEVADAAVAHGVEVAARFDAAVEFLTVVDVRDLENAPTADDRRAAARDVVADLAARADERGLEGRHEVRTGVPAEAILEHVEDVGADLVVVGTHGRTGYRRLVLGSVAESVLRAAPVPVLTVPPAAAGGEDYQDVLVPTDGSSCAERATDWALTLARRYGARVHGLSVVEPDALGLDVRSAALLDRHRQAATDAVESVAAAAEADGLAVESAVREGRPHRAIGSYVDERGVDLVVMGTHGGTDLDRLLLGSVAERTVRTSPVPVVTVRERSQSAPT